MGGEVKQVTLKGPAAEAYLNHGKVRRSRTRKNKAQMGGADDIPPGPSLAQNANYKRAANITKVAETATRGGGHSLHGGGKAASVLAETATATQKGGAVTTSSDIATAAPITTMRSMPGTVAQNPTHIETPAVKAQLEAGTNPPTTDQQGGGKKKLVLAPAKKKTRGKVLLTAPSSSAKPRSAGRGIHQTRKIRVQLSGLKKRLTKAKTIRKDSQEKPIGEVRKLLEEAKLIKPQLPGKAPVPESVLRDIYKDYLLLRNRAL
jgi:hypothetical protein